MPEKQPNLDSLFEAAVQIESAEERAAFLDSSCGENHELRQQVEQLLQSDEQAGSFLDKPPADLEATLLTDGDGRNLAASLDAGLAPAFGEDAAVVIGNAGHSVLLSLGRTIDIPRVVLRESQAEGDDPIARLRSPEMPTGNSDSRYQLQGEIARGGMGAILKGRDTDLGRDLAIKVLLDQHKDKPEVIQRFVEEAQIGGQLQHPGIAPIYELGQFSDKRPFFAMKLVKGETLSKLLADREDAADERGKFIGIFEQVCQTMAYAHSRGVIHRDLKPANIMVGAFGEVQVMDWGLAKVLQVGGIADEKKSQVLQKGQSIIQTMRSVGSDSPPGFGSAGSETQMGSVMGTPAYMPPEQALGEIDQMDERADVFGLGAILCEILTGKPPYVAEDGTRVFRMASRGKLDDAFSRLDTCGADEDLIALTKHCLELDPKDRPRDAGVLAERVTGYLESVESKLRETEVKRAAEAARAIEARKRMRVTMALAASVLLMLSLGGGGWVWIQQQVADRREVATTKVNSALSDAQVHQSLADSAELEMQVAKLDKAVSSAQQAVELAEQNDVEVSLSNRAKTMLAALQTRATNVRELAQQARRDREFQEALELIRLSQADGGAQEITIEDSQDGRGAPHGEGSEESNEALMVSGPPKKIIFQLFDISSAAKRYEEVFQEAGLDLSTLDVSQAAALIRSSAIRESQIAAIDNWARAIPRPEPPSETAATEPAAAETNSPEDGDKSTLTGVNTNDLDTVALRQKLLAIANAADDSEWRRTVRAALEANDTTKLKELAATDEARSQSPELIAWLGAALRDGEEAEASVAVLLQAQRQNPGDFWLNYELGKSFSKQDNHLEGLGFTRAALAIRPESLGALMALAASSSSAKRYEDAAAIYRSVVKQNPKLVEAHVELASVATSLEQWEEAITAYRTVLELEPKNVEVRASMGVAYRSAQQYREAIDTCRKAVELDPRNVYAHLCLGQVLSGLTLEGVSQNKAAEQEFRLVLELDPTNARAYYYSGVLKQRYMGDQKGGVADLLTAIRLDPKFVGSYSRLAHSLASDSPEEAAVLARQAIELDPRDPYAHTTLAISMNRAARWDEALAAGRNAVFVDPEDFFAHTVLGSALEGLGRRDEAVIEYRKALEINPELSYWARYKLAPCLIAQGNPEEAVTVLAPLYPRGERDLWFMNAIETELRKAMTQLAEQGRLDEAGAGIRMILENKGTSDVVIEFLVSALRDSGFADKLSACRKLVEWAPESATAQTHLSRELQKQGLQEEAFMACRKALELAPTSSEPYEQLASLFQAQEGVDNVAAYSKVLESYPNIATVLNSFAWRLVTTSDADGKYQHLDKAIQWAQRACDLKPDSGAIWNTLAVAQYRRGQWQAAIDSIAQSQQLGYAEEPSNWLFLTMAHWQLGNREQATRAYGRAISARQQTETDQELQSFFTEARNILGRTGLEQTLASTPDNTEVAAELANLVLDSKPVDWTILEPTEMTSERGATLTLLKDGSILAGGENSPGESYHLVMQSDLKSITAFRLEVLTDPGLPGQGPGRGKSGNFGVHWNFQSPNPTGSGDSKPIPIRSAIADYSYARYPITDSRWNIAGGQGLPHTAFLALDAPLQNEAGNSFTLTIKGPTGEKYGDENLGRFRLSVTDAPFAFENASVRFAAMTLSDPWTKLAAAYDIVGDQQALARVLEQHPEAASLELAQFLAERGKISLASQHVNEALPPLVKARELFASISAKHPESKWTVLEPTKISSAGGATLTKLDDHSILASGVNPEKEVYEFETQLEGGDFTAIRLEGLTHPSLENKSHGRSIGNGNVVLTEFEAEVAFAETPEDWRPIKFNNAWTDNPEASRDFENAIDGDLTTGWTTDHKDVPLDRTAIFTAETPFGHKSGTRLRIRLRHESEWVHHAFGRIRLSVTRDPDAIEAAPFYQQLAESDLAGLELALGNAYGQLGQVDEAATAFHQTLDLADDHDARTKVVLAASAYDSVLDKLTKLWPKDAALHDALARHSKARGELITARAAAATARTLYQQQLAAEPANSVVAKSLADLLLDEADAWHWTVLTPTEMKSAGGATLTLLEDNSVLSGGTHPNRDDYTIKTTGSTGSITSILLEALPDASLSGSVGRGAAGFIITEVEVTQEKDSGEQAPLSLVEAAADFERTHPNRIYDARFAIDGKNGGEGWCVAPQVKSPHWLVLKVGQPGDVPASALTFVIRHNHFDPSGHKSGFLLGRFRLSVSDDPRAFETAKGRFFFQQLTDPWTKLAVAYHLIEDQQALDQLLEQHPEAAVGLGDIHLANQEWQQAIGVYDSLITDETTDPNLLDHRAQVHAALEQWDEARADWSRAVGENPELNHAVFETFRKANRVREATEFGLRAIQQKPDDVNLWEQLAPILLLTDNEAAWREQSARAVQQWADTTDADLARKVWRACLLAPGGVKLEELPEQILIVPADTKLNQKQLTDIWTTRALLAYRRGDAKAALEYTKKSQDLGPWSGTRAINVAVQALAHHELKEVDKAIATLERARNQFTASQSYAESSRAWPHAAEVLLREAEAKIGENQNSTGEVADPATSKKAPAVERENKKVPETN